MAMSAEDRLAIADLYARSSWAADVGDIDGFVATFTATAVLDLAKRHEGTQAIRAFAEEARQKDPWLPFSQRIVSQLVMDGDGSKASVRAYLTRTHRLPGRSRNNCLVVWTGYCTDTVVKAGDGWLFAEHIERAWEGPIVERIARARNNGT